MKDSGVAWIGDIPENWSIIRAKYTYTNANVGESIDKKYWSNENDDYVFYTAGLKSIHTNWGNFPKWKLVKENDLLLSRNGTPYVYFPTKNALYSDHIIRICINTNYDKRYVRYCLQRSIEHYIIDVVSIATWSISLWAEQNIIKPPLSQQKEIADYLDTKCAEIESICADILSEIETLEKYKKSVITEAVTKGLQPDVVMKDSGIEWIGEIPDNWCIKKLKHCLLICNGRDYSSIEVESGGYPVIGSGGEFTRASKFIYNRPSILFGRKGTIDKPIYIDEPFWSIDTMYYTKCILGVEKYLYYASSSLIQFQLYMTSTALPSMTQFDLGSTLISFPPIDEQKTIADYLDNTCSEIDELIQEKKEQLTTLSEYKKSLIYEYVTGKRCLNIS